jgi:hypothetical protein
MKKYGTDKVLCCVLVQTGSMLKRARVAVSVTPSRDGFPRHGNPSSDSNKLH